MDRRIRLCASFSGDGFVTGVVLMGSNGAEKNLGKLLQLRRSHAVNFGERVNVARAVFRHIQKGPIRENQVPTYLPLLCNAEAKLF